MTVYATDKDRLIANLYVIKRLANDMIEESRRRGVDSDRDTTFFCLSAGVGIITDEAIEQAKDLMID
jgi:hypothetical protein